MRVLSGRDHSILDQVLVGCALFGRDDWLPIVATGKDHRKFLHAMLTQDVKGLDDGALRMTCLCDAQGAIEGAALQVLEPERAVLWTERGLATRLRDELDKYVIMDELDLTVDEDLALIQLVGATAQDIASKAGLPWPDQNTWTPAQLGQWPLGVGRIVFGGGEGSPAGPALPCLLVAVHRDLLGEVAGAIIDAGAMPGSHAALDALRVAGGWPLLGGVDVDDGSLPLEVGLKGAVDFRKGCYRGQEAIAMMTYRGQIRRHLCWVERAGDALPDTGWLLKTAEGKRAGRMGRGILYPDGRWLGLAVVQRRAYGAGVELQALGPAGEVAAVRVVATTVPGVLDTATEGA